MKKLYSLKSWFSLQDTAERLTNTLKEPVSVEDIEQLVSEAYLKPTIRVCEIGFSREELEAFEARHGKTRPHNDNLHPKERDSLLKLVLGMAIDAYGYDVKASRSPIYKDISDSLATHGISVSDDTIRKLLNQGKDICDLSQVSQ